MNPTDVAENCVGSHLRPQNNNNWNVKADIRCRNLCFQFVLTIFPIDSHHSHQAPNLRLYALTRFIDYPET